MSRRDLHPPNRVGNYAVSTGTRLTRPSCVERRTEYVRSAAYGIVHSITDRRESPLYRFAGGKQHPFGPDLRGTDFTVDHLFLNETVKMYTGFAEQVRLNVTRLQSNSDEASTRMSLTGYLVDVP